MGHRSAHRAPVAPIRSSLSQPSAPAALDDRILLAVILLVAAALRGWLPFGHVFTGAFVNLQTNDSWYHARLIDNLLRNFPHPLHFDVYAAYGGAVVAVARCSTSWWRRRRGWLAPDLRLRTRPR